MEYMNLCSDFAKDSSQLPYLEEGLVDFIQTFRAALCNSFNFPRIFSKPHPYVSKVRETYNGPEEILHTTSSPKGPILVVCLAGSKIRYRLPDTGLMPVKTVF